jgi:hypothetical protein
VHSYLGLYTLYYTLYDGVVDPYIASLGRMCTKQIVQGIIYTHLLSLTVITLCTWALSTIIYPLDYIHHRNEGGKFGWEAIFDETKNAALHTLSIRLGGGRDSSPPSERIMTVEVPPGLLPGE